MESSSNWWRPSRPPEPVRTGLRDVSDTPGYTVTFWALIGFTVVLLLAPQEQFPALGVFRLALLSAATAFIACGYNRVSRRMPLIEFSPDVVLLLLLTGWAVVTIPFSYWPGGSVATLTDHFLKAFICFLLLSHAVSDFRQLRAISWCLVLCAVPLTLVTLGNYVSGTHMGGSGDRIVGHASGLTENPNDMALMLNLILPVCIALLLGTKGSFKKLVLAGITLLIVMAVIATFSRAGFLTLVFIGICYAWLLRKRPQRIWIPIILIMGLFAVPFVPTSYFERIDTILNIEEDQTNSAQTRLSDMQVAAGTALSNPLVGAGLGMSALALNEARGELWVDVHNVYLQWALDLGFPGLLLYLLLLYQCLRVTGNIINSRSDDAAAQPMVFLAEALRVSLLAFAFAAMFYPVAYNIYFYFFAGLAIAAGRIVRDDGRETAQ